MREPLIVERSNISEVRQVAEGEEILQTLVFVLPAFRRFLISLGSRKMFALTDVRRDIHPDPIEPRAVEHAPGVEKIARRGKCHGWHHGLQVWWILDRRQPLH